MRNVIFTTEQRIIHELMMRALSSKSIGLFDGKMGLAIAFFHLYRKTGASAYEKYAYALLDSVLNNVTRNMGISLGTGLSGIGWGIEYLLQNRFADGDVAEICEQIDQQIMCYDPRRISDNSLVNGFSGLLHYIFLHCKDGIKFDVSYIADVEDVVSKMYNGKVSFKEQAQQYNIDLMKFVLPIDISDGFLHTKPIGIYGGLSGLLIQNYIEI